VVNERRPTALAGGPARILGLLLLLLAALLASPAQAAEFDFTGAAVKDDVKTLEVTGLDLVDGVAALNVASLGPDVAKVRVLLGGKKLCEQEVTEVSSLVLPEGCATFLRKPDFDVRLLTFDPSGRRFPVEHRIVLAKVKGHRGVNPKDWRNGEDELVAGQIVLTAVDLSAGCQGTAAVFVQEAWHQVEVVACRAKAMDSSLLDAFARVVLAGDGVPVWVEYTGAKEALGHAITKRSAPPPDSEGLEPVGPWCDEVLGSKSTLWRQGQKELRIQGPKGEPGWRSMPYLLCVQVDVGGEITWALRDGLGGWPWAPPALRRGHRVDTLGWLEAERWIEVVVRKDPSVYGVDIIGGGEPTGGQANVVQTEQGSPARLKTTEEGSSKGGAWREFLLAPRKAGGFGIEIQQVLRPKDATTAPVVGRTAKAELVTLRSYGAGLRFGLGVAYGVDQSLYGVRTFGGVSTVYRTRRHVFTPEFVVGIAVFWRPRTFVPRRLQVWAPTPYIGVGVLGPSYVAKPLPVDFFHSVHLGFDWQFSGFASLTVAVSIRGTRKLAPGLYSGAVVPDPTDYLVGGVTAGPSIVLNLSPIYFRTLALNSNPKDIGKVGGKGGE
jgi:hypothetical protein